MSIAVRLDNYITLPYIVIDYLLQEHYLEHIRTNHQKQCTCTGKYKWVVQRISSDKGKFEEEYIWSVKFSELKQMKKIKLIVRRMNLEDYLQRKYTRRKSHFERSNTLEEVCERERDDHAGKIIMQAERNEIGKRSTGERYGNFCRIIVGNTFQNGKINRNRRFRKKELL